MTIKQLIELLEAEKIDFSPFSFSPDELSYGEIGYYIRQSEDLYIAYLTERDEILTKIEVTDENDACRWMLGKIAVDYPKLKKYV